MKDEGSLFAPKAKSDKDIDDHLNSLFRYSKRAIPIVKSKYASISDAQGRLTGLISDVFLCNTPSLIKAYPNKT
jgi:hypothetical protein